jgi:hypothetical protein
MANNINKKYLTFGITILILVAAVIYLDLGNLFSVSRTPIGEISRIEGRTMTRSARASQWQLAQLNAKVFSGDFLATQGSSQTITSFDEFRRIQLGQNSRVRITDMKYQGSQNAILVLLDEGTVSANMGGCTSCAPIYIQSGNQTFSASFDSDIGVVKSKTAEKAQAFSKPIEAKAIATPQARLEFNFDFLKKLEEVKQVEEKKAPIPAPKFQSRFPAQYWTWAAMREAVGLFSMNIELPLASSSNSQWNWIVILNGKNSLRGRQAVFKPPFEEIQKAADKRRLGAIDHWSWSVQVGSLENETRTMSPEQRKFQAYSLARIPKNNIRIDLRNISASEKMSPKAIARQPGLRIYLRNEQASLRPYINGSKEVAITQDEMPQNLRGTILLRNNEIEAFIIGTEKKQEVIKVIPHDLVLEGLPSSILGSINDDRIVKKLPKNKTVRIHRKNGSIPLQTGIIRKAPSVLKILQKEPGTVVYDNDNSNQKAVGH